MKETGLTINLMEKESKDMQMVLLMKASLSMESNKIIMLFTSGELGKFILDHLKMDICKVEVVLKFLMEKVCMKANSQEI